MEIWFVIASGQSLTEKQVEKVRKAHAENRVAGVIAVSNVGIDLYPDADALVAHDGKWWAHNKEAHDFKGRKFCRNRRGGVEQFFSDIPTGCNSGYMAIQVAWKVFKADLIIILGFDMKGAHYFGKHPEPLKNTKPERFLAHIKQFNNWRGPTVINCTPDSALKKFPLISLDKVLG